MKSQLIVVGLGGSLAKHSSSLAALKIALQGAKETGAKTALLAPGNIETDWGPDR